jgi:hypothetical protein
MPEHAMSRCTVTKNLDLLTAAFGDDEQAIAAWQRWRAEIDWDEHIDHTSFRLLPRACRRLRRLGFEDPIFPRCKGIERQAWLSNQRLLSTWKPTLQHLAEAKIESLLLPPAWALAWDRATVLDHGKPIAWAIDPEHAERTIRLMLAMGWYLKHARVPAWCLRGYIAGTNHLLLHPPGDGLPWLLNWSLDHWRPWREFRTAAQPRELAGHSVLVLTPEHALGYLLWQPVAWQAYGLLAEVLTIVEAREISDWLGDIPIPARGFPNGWDELLDRAGTLLRDIGLPQSFGRAESFLHPPASTRRGAISRLLSDWRTYESVIGGNSVIGERLQQLPGYLMSRWQIDRISRLPLGALAWLRHKAQRGRPV